MLFREEDKYWIPEIYRHGLYFGVTGTGRPKVALRGGRDTVVRRLLFVRCWL